MKKYGIIILYLALPLIPGGVLYFSDPEKYSDLGLLAGMIFGVCAFTWLIAEVVCIARVKYFDRVYGMDFLFRIHGYMAVSAIILSISHRFIEEAQLGSMFAGTVGDIALSAFIFSSVMSILFMANTFVSGLQPVVKLRIAVGGIKLFGYEVQRFIHNLALPAMIVLYIHVMLTSSASEYISVKIVYSMMFSASLMFYIYHKIIKRIILRQNRYVVKKVKSENRNVWTLELVPLNGNVFEYKPGQFGFLRLYGEGIPHEEHPFSFSSDPSDKRHVSVTIKDLGNYTSMVKNTKAGYTASLDGPYGNFSYLNYPDETETVLIAGGVGITPALSMLRYMKSQDKNRNVTLIWGLGSSIDLMNTEDFESMKKEMKNLHIATVKFRDDTWTGEKGIIDHILIARLLKLKGHNIGEVGFYICGPAPMLRLVLESLRHIGIRNKQIHYERFSL